MTHRSARGHPRGRGIRGVAGRLEGSPGQLGLVVCSDVNIAGR